MAAFPNLRPSCDAWLAPPVDLSLTIQTMYGDSVVVIELAPENRDRRHDCSNDASSHARMVLCRSSLGAVASPSGKAHWQNEEYDFVPKCGAI